MCCCALFSAKGADSLRLEVRDGRYFVIHEVEAKETLYSLSKRYLSPIDSIKRNNELRNGGIDLGQLLMIPIAAPIEEIEKSVEEESKDVIDIRRKIHEVQPGETVYSLTRQYGIEDIDLREWNGLPDNTLSIGMTLYVSPPVQDEPPIEKEKDEEIVDEENMDEIVAVDESEESEDQPEPEEDLGDYYSHYVQSGETLSQLARRFETIPDSLIAWNELESTSLRIGDKLIVKKPIELDSLNHSNPKTRFTSYGSKYWKETTEQNTLIHEEGIAGTIENIIETKKLLALHRTLPVGAVMKVVNLMNHESTEVKVVGKLPNTGLNRNMMIRFTDATFKQLGIIDKKSRVEIIYLEDKG